MPVPKSYFKCACQNCGGHIEFPATGAGETILCPHCGWQTILEAPADPPAPPRRKSFAAGMVVTVLVAGGVVAGWQFLHRRPAPPPVPVKAAPVKEAAPAPVPVAPAPPPDLWHGLKTGPVALEKAENGDLVYVVGVLRNESDHERFGVKVLLNLFNDQDAKVGTASDYVASILPGKEWKFRALVLERKVARAEVAKVTEQE